LRKGHSFPRILLYRTARMICRPSYKNEKEADPGDRVDGGQNPRRSALKVGVLFSEKEKGVWSRKINDAVSQRRHPRKGVTQNQREF